jgi:N-acyl homoserine lactone hydrolase
MQRLRALRRRPFSFAAVLLVVVAVTTLVVRDRPIARAEPHAFVAPPPVEAGTIAACWVELARNTASGQVATAGLTRTRTWDVTVSGLLVRHPRGDVMIDVGNSSTFAEEIADYPLLDRTWLETIPGSNRTVATAPAALRALGVDPAHLTVVPSHAHVDHVGGLVDLPAARVLMAPEEIAWARSHESDQYVHVVAAQARSIARRVQPLVFEPRPYETFDESADLFGDGTVVVVKLFGHTPGSVGVFVNVSPERRLLHVGDAVNVMEAVERRLTKSVVMASTDHLRDAADRVVARLAQLHEADPGLVVLPAHDRSAWQRALGAPGACIR